MEERLDDLSTKDRQELRNIRTLLWGSNDVEQTIFERWSQGFEFSELEPSALVQCQGGPCAVIAPVQAFLLKILLMDTPGYSFYDLTADKCRTVLIQAICNILMKCKETKYRIVTLRAAEEAPADEVDAARVNAADPDASPSSPPAGEVPEAPEHQPAVWDPDQFHERLTIQDMETIDEVEKFYTENPGLLAGQYGVLLFLYSVLATKGIENVVQELNDTSEPLIHGTYGYGSQGLINLMLTGRAVAHVWDNDEDVGGLKLRGINQQSDIGFITTMEQMRYCTVGSFYKNPKNPVWVMASETHLSVLFSTEKRLVSPETPSEIARRVFKSYDPEGNNFIPSVVLQDVLCTLDLVSDKEYVDIMRSKLDPENLGIILLNGFMDEFFPQEKRSMPDTFVLWHYNGIPGSNFGSKVKYNRGVAILLESDLKLMCNISNPMLMCLQTKWPNIEVNWQEMRTPSLN
ncbi:ubiquitin carboxyl-terminal hydrolase MINDY-3 homolog [Phlebotomus argentipes]|uniref:ubiquitin carboxyl-terminal hydrolase MINDY-3 homolog n=1 Tax=Phlebotomus argentipes TaxID=94469 RepID=UPI002892E951|nr:ubiquitin carboxyl-terminal hydrolase MINDY-3 homolog [Phlebotomus argentipes]